MKEMELVIDDCPYPKWIRVDGQKYKVHSKVDEYVIIKEASKKREAEIIRLDKEETKEIKSMGDKPNVNESKRIDKTSFSKRGN